MQRLHLTFLLCTFAYVVQSQNIAILKYKGGGDWYSNPTAVPNLIAYCNSHINTRMKPKPETVDAGSTDIFQYPMVFATGHGNIIFEDDEIENLRTYLLSGGFLHIDDNYGMHSYLTNTLKQVFPDKDLIELPKNHAIFNSAYEFSDGLPKIHEHDGKRPQALGLFHNDRLILLFTYESDLSDGWEDQVVHNDPEDVREKALKMGANIVKYAFEN